MAVRDSEPPPMDERCRRDPDIANLRQRWAFFGYFAAKRLDFRSCPRYMNRYAPGGITDLTIQLVCVGQAIAKRPETHPLDDAFYFNIPADAGQRAGRFGMKCAH